MKFALHNVIEEPLFFDEMKVKQYKDLLKSVFGDNPLEENFTETFYDILFSLGKKPSDFYRKLNIYQLFQILTKIRIQTFGEECIAAIKKDNTNYNLYINLPKLLDDSEAPIRSFHNSEIQQDGIKVCFSLPTIDRTYKLPEGEEYLSCISNVTIKNKTVFIENNEDARCFIDNVSPKLLIKIAKHYKEFVQNLINTNLLNRYNIEEQKLLFLPTVSNLIWYCKLYFNETLESFYETIFALSHYGKIEASYIETCTPGEYIFLAKKLAATIKEKNAAIEEEQQVAL